MTRLHAGGRLFAVLIVAALLIPAGASAAKTEPAVTTGEAADVAPSTVTLTGSVDPNGRDDGVHLPVRADEPVRRHDAGDGGRQGQEGGPRDGAA